MVKINMHRVAVAVTKMEGGKVNLPIAQVKEVISKLFILVRREEWTAAQLSEVILRKK
jgi:hypothetical protein